MRWAAAAGLWNKADDLVSFVKIPLGCGEEQPVGRCREAGWMVAA